MSSKASRGGDEVEQATPARREFRLLLAPAVSIILGGLSLLLMLHVLAGVPAIVLGFVGLRGINASFDETSLGLRWGRRLAVAGMVLGLAGSVLGIVMLLSLRLAPLNEASRRDICANQLREIGRAVKSYYDAHDKTYPGATVDAPLGPALFAPWLAEPYADRLGWLVNVLPYLEVVRHRKAEYAYESLARTFDPRQAWRASANAEGADTSIREFLCPSHPKFDAAVRPALSYYVGSTGIDPAAVELPRDAPRAGFFGYERRLRGGVNLPDPLPRGQGYTLLATETMEHNGPWVAGNRSTLRGFNPAEQPYVGYGHQFGGLHPGGVNLLMVDTSVIFFSEHGQDHVLEEKAVLSVDE
jgi:hypothetical protein